MKIIKSKKAFTLFEVVTVMIIIAIVVGISLKLAKTKLNNIKSYTYYNAYQTLTASMREMIYNFSTLNETYVGENEHNCPEGQTWNHLGEDGKCETTPTTLPRDPDSFCQLFASYVNTINNTEDEDSQCKGDSVDFNTNFLEAIPNPDITLKNGMRIYNMTNDIQNNIAILNNNSNGVTYYNSSGEQIDVDTSGYLIFVDIYGTSGKSELWQGIYPFYITMSGKVIPAYDGNIGGSNKEYLMMSAYNDVILNDRRRTNWLAKSVSFKEAACASGYIKAATPYCSQDTSVGLNVQCAPEDSDCRIKAITPTKLFFN